MGRPGNATLRRRRGDGYIDIWAPGHPMARKDGYACEHRVLAYDAGLLTDPSMHVHHVNHDKTDNRLENLEVLTAEDHKRRHVAEEGAVTNQYGTWGRRPLRAPKIERQCEGCGATVSIAVRADARFCSEGCRIRTWKRRNKGRAA